MEYIPPNMVEEGKVVPRWRLSRELITVILYLLPRPESHCCEVRGESKEEGLAGGGTEREANIKRTAVQYGF